MIVRKVKFQIDTETCKIYFININSIFLESWYHRYDWLYKTANFYLYSWEKVHSELYGSLKFFHSFDISRRIILLHLKGVAYATGHYMPMKTTKQRLKLQDIAVSSWSSIRHRDVAANRADLISGIITIIGRTGKKSAHLLSKAQKCYL